MRRFGDMTVREIGRLLARYQPFFVTIVAIALVAALLPGDAEEETLEGPVAQREAESVGQADAVAGDTTARTREQAPEEAEVSTGTVQQAEAGRQADAAATPEQDTEGAEEASTPRPQGIQWWGSDEDPMAAPDCDPETGRMMIPTNYAASCVPVWPQGRDNFDATHRGVTEDTITIAIRETETDPAVEAVVVAAGADDTDEEQRATRQAWIDLFEAHYETYGRSVEVVYFDASGDDDAAQRADAIKVAEEIEAFAAWGGPRTYTNELAARGVICLCASSVPLSDYHDQAPYVWGTQPALEQWLWPAAEYIGKRTWGTEAEWAGDVEYQLMERRFAIVYSESEEQPYVGRGIDFFEEQLAGYGAHLTDRISYAPDINRAQEQSRSIIARLNDRDITTVVFWGDAIAPIFLTQEATRQNYYPEWFITGGNLTDTTFWGRSYDQTQWQNAYGISQLWARPDQENDEMFKLYRWHHDESPPAAATYEIIFQSVWIFMTGVHLAGPNLNPETFRDALFSFPPSGGGPTTILRAYGQHGFWPWEDYSAFTDTTEVWWDPNAAGENEIGQYGAGMWRYVDGGRRYLPDEWPSSYPEVFELEGSVTNYDEQPPEDQPPSYPDKRYRRGEDG